MLSFIYPAALFVMIPSLALIVFAYLRKGRSKVLTVSSLFFLRHLPQLTPAGRSKFIPPSRFFWDILLAGLLCLALAGIYLRRHDAQKVAYLIDNSLSMAARAPNQSSLLEQAIESTKSSISLRSTTSQTSIWTTSPSPHALTDGFVPASEAEKALDSIKFSFSKDSFERALGEVAPKASQLYVYSDRSQITDQKNLENIHPARFRYQDDKLQNVGIVGVRLNAASKDSAGPSVAVSVEAFSQSPIPANLKLSQLQSSTWQLVDQSNIEILPSEKKEILLHANSSNAPLRIQLSTQDPSLNALPYDDVAWIAPTHEESVLNVVSSFQASELGLDQLSTFKVNRIDPSELSKPESFKNSLKPGPILYHRSVPSDLPARDAIFVLPPEGNALFSVDKPAQNATLTRWQDNHQILSYLSFQAMELGELSPFKSTPAWAQDLISTSKGPIAFAGIRSGHRYIGLGFELLPFEGRKSISASILLLNMLKWLGQSSDFSSGYIDLASAHAKQSFSNIKLIDSMQSIDSATNSAETIGQPGLYKVSNGQNEEFVAVNFFDDSESNTYQPDPYLLPSATHTDADKSNFGLPLVRWISILLLAFISADLIFRLFRRQKKVMSL